jgi:SAM-dependent methyltransferase
VTTHGDADALPPALFERADETPDLLFYAQPRFVTHIDDATIAALTRYYAEILFADADVLDLMSSWVSHLPASPELGRVAGLGMNEAELAGNPRLTERLVHDLNSDPNLPYENGSFDFVFIAVSIQYLVRPLAVFADIARVLRPGGQIVVSMSHRCFPTKAIRAFQSLGASERVQLVAEYIVRAQEFAKPEFIDRSPPGADPLWLVRAGRE